MQRMQMLLKVSDVAKEYGVSAQTTRNWIKNNEFEYVKRTKGGHYRIGKPNPDRLVVGYTRVSSRKQLSSIGTQTIQIKSRYPEIKIISDVGSGFNFKRKGFVSLLEFAMSGIAIEIVVSNRDRLCRVGFDFVQSIFERTGGKITTLNQSNSEQGQFDTELLVGFTTSFCNSYYGKRSAKNKRSLTKDQVVP
jgi:predicted site-specific integrase-resolvase